MPRTEIEPVAVVSGGSRGIGREVCRQRVERGYEVILGSRNFDQGVRKRSLSRPRRYPGSILEEPRVFAPSLATAWTDVGVPLLLAFLAFVGSAIAVFWPWLQTRFRGRKFEGIIRRELEEIGPHPRQPVEGKPWWEHATKRFVHEEVFARERISENRDFLLSLDPAVVYRVSQLWTSLGKRDGTQWVYFLGDLANDTKVGSDSLREAHRDWQAVMDKQPNELKTLPRVREDASAMRLSEPLPALIEARLNAYGPLLELTNVGSPGERITIKGKERQQRARALTNWFYSGGGLLLSGDALRAFLAARDWFEAECATTEELRGALSALRTELKIDLGVRHPDERDVPMASSQHARAWA